MLDFEVNTNISAVPSWGVEGGSFEIYRFQGIDTYTLHRCSEETLLEAHDQQLTLTQKLRKTTKKQYNPTRGRTGQDVEEG